MRQLTIPQIERPERFFPEPVLIKEPQVRILDDGFGELWLDKREEWGRIHPICVEIIDALKARLSYEELVKSLSEYPDDKIVGKIVPKIARKFCWQLATMGFVHFDLEPAPDVFNGRYRRLKELGRGGLGIAHLCADEAEGDAHVVVKHPWGIKQPIERGQRAVAAEAAGLAAMEHPSVPRFVETFAVRGLLHLVKGYVEGTKLSSKYGGKGITDVAERRRVALEMADLLGYIHDRGFIFFDGSPDNFFVAPEGHLVCTDFGSAKPHENGRVRINGPRGTPAYVAPEQARRGPDGHRWADIRCDIFTFGRTYYYLVTGGRPRRSWFYPQLSAHLEETGMAAGDRAIIEACCQDRPDKRPPTMCDVRRLIESSLPA